MKEKQRLENFNAPYMFFYILTCIIKTYAILVNHMYTKPNAGEPRNKCVLYMLTVCKLNLPLKYMSRPLFIEMKDGLKIQAFYLLLVLNWNREENVHVYM